MKSIIIVTIVLCLYAFFRELCQPSGLNNFNKDYAIRLRGILCIMIVLHHTSYIDSDMRGWGAPVVDVFMFMSGYGLMKSYMAKGIAYLKGFFHKRVCKILFPLVFVTFIHSISMHFIYSYDLDSFTQDIKVGRAPIGATWYLYVSLYFYMSFYLSAKYIKHIFGQWALLLLLSFSFLLFILSTGDVWRYWAAPSFVMLSGVVYCYYESSIRNVINKNKKFTLSLIPLCMIVFFLVMRAIPYSSYLIHALYPIPIVWLTYFVNIPKKFCYVGIISFEIYLVHDSIISHVLPLALPHHIYVLFVVIITLPLAVLLNLFNKKVLYKL